MHVAQIAKGEIQHGEPIPDPVRAQEMATPGRRRGVKNRRSQLLQGLNPVIGNRPRGQNPAELRRLLGSIGEIESARETTTSKASFSRRFADRRR